MKQATLKRAFLSLMAVATLTLALGSITQSYAQWGNNRNRDNDRYEERNRRSRNQQDCDVYGNPRNGNNRGGYDNNRGGYGNNRGGYDGYGNNNNRSGGYYNPEEEKGYRDGLRRGQEDLQSRRIADPSNSSHYRDGSSSYREGFRRGYQDGYPRNYNSRRW